MGKPELLYNIIELIVLLIPLCAVVYKLGKTCEKLNDHARRLKLCEEKEMEIDKDTEASLSTITVMLNDIKVSIARLEERVSKNKKEETT